MCKLVNLSVVSEACKQNCNATQIWVRAFNATRVNSAGIGTSSNLNEADEQLCYVDSSSNEEG